MPDPVVILDASGSGAAPEVRPPTGAERAAAAAIGAEDARRRRREDALAAEDAVRLRLVAERGADDPAFAALAELLLRGRAGSRGA